MSLQDELNRIGSTSGKSVRDCFKTLAGGDQNRSTRELANAYCGTINQTIQDALNAKAGRTASQERLSKTDAAKLIPTI